MTTSSDDALSFDPEKLVEPYVDDDYDTRTGYDENFLSIAVPIPMVADPSVVARLDDGSDHVICYEHFSIVMHRARRLALLCASNVDASPRAKKPEPGRDYSRRGLSGLGENDQEKWVLDPRIAAAAQLPDKFYTKDRGNFDKGHIVRRDDVAWGKDYAEVRRANGDTYHVTNCSPQIDAFNRSNLRGEWGLLENYVLGQAKSERLCVFAGPVLDDENDRLFRGRDDDGAVEVQIPSKFWKVVVTATNGELQSYAFLLEQDLRDAEVELDLTAEWAAKLIAIPDLEQVIPDLLFDDAVRDSDQYEAAAGESVRRAATLERYRA